MANPHDEPALKAQAIDSLITALTGKNRHTTITAGLCMTCDANPILPFTDQLSRQEYRISGMCQACQDETFGGDEE